MMVFKANPGQHHRRPAMKTVAIVLAVSTLVATSAVARTIKVDNGNIYYSHAQGAQAYANPDRTYGTGNEPPAQ
jgi:hypothetical protein